MAALLSATEGTSVQQLRERMQRMQQTTPWTPLATHPALTDLVQLRTGASYRVDSAGLAMALMAGPSQAGAWSAVIGIPEFGIEAAAGMGVDLSRTILVPAPGEHWLETVAAMVDVVTVVVVRPGVSVRAQVASRLGARLRKHAAMLVALGEWPRSELEFSVEASTWTGAGRGDGHLRSRQVVVAARHGAAPPVRAPLWLPAPDGQLRRCETAALSEVDMREAN